MNTCCQKCNKPISKSYGGLCQGCYRYFRKDGGIIHPLPSLGEIKYDSEGKVICHICGRSYTRLGSHIKESHGMTIEEYKEAFGLCRRTKTTESVYSSLMSKSALKNKMDERLKVVGQATRIKKGENTMRKNKPVRLQEVIDKRKRGKIAQ